MSNTTESSGPDFRLGIPESDLADGGMLAGHVDDDPILLARRGTELFAVGAKCTHYGGPLHEGLMVDDTVRCPWHHACFSLRTGEALRAPAFAALERRRVERRDGRIFVHEKLQPVAAKPRIAPTAADPMVIIGGGAAGYAAAEMLRREGYGGKLTMISADDSAPYDRPNLSKDYLAGKAPEDWMPLSPDAFYAENDIELRLGTVVEAIAERRVKLGNGETIAFSKLLLATGAEPIRLDVPGAEFGHVHTLRSFADCRAIIARIRPGSRALVVGASFIGLEAAAALRQRDVAVHVVTPEQRPMERIFGAHVADFLRSLHEEHGVVFHLGRTVAEIEARGVRLDDGSRVEADFVLVGIGVKPRLELAEKAGLAVDRGVLVNEYLETSAPNIFAAGDIARWPDPHSGERLRIEHWVVAERLGQVAARNMLGRRERFAAVPFFWTQHYDVSVDYVGHAASFDEVEQDGDVKALDVALRFRKDGRLLAVATIFRGLASLEAERAMEKATS